MINLIKKFFLFWYRFLIGDDWIGAVIILLGFVLTYVFSRHEVAAYWFLPAAVLLSLGSSIVRIHRRNALNQQDIVAPGTPRRASSKV